MDRTTQLKECPNPKCYSTTFEKINDHTVCCTECLEEFGYCYICGEFQETDRLQGAPFSVVEANGGYTCKGRCGE